MTALAITTLVSILAATDDSSTPEPWDCGAKALYQMLRLEGRPVELSRLIELLGPSTSEGRSFLSLRRAAGECGLNLEAVALSKSQSSLNGPALAFIRGENEGHFLVVRPVGHTGRLVQILDGDNDPSVIDVESLRASPAWTGLILIPKRTNWPAVVSVVVFLASTLALALRLIIHRSRRSTDPIPLTLSTD